MENRSPEGKLVADTVGHVPREISRAEIPDGKRKYLDGMKSIVELNYDEYFLPENYDLNELQENVGTEDLHIGGDEDDHIIDDEDKMMLYL